MATVYLDEQGSEIKKHGELLIVEKEGSVIAEMPMAQLDRIVIIGNVQITTQAAALLLDKTPARRPCERYPQPRLHNGF